MPHGVSKVFVSAIVQNKRIPESLLEEVNEKISLMCKIIFVYNSNISIVIYVCVCVSLFPSTVEAFHD